MYTRASFSFTTIVQQRDTDDEVKDHIRQNLHLREKVSMLKLSSLLEVVIFLTLYTVYYTALCLTSLSKTVRRSCSEVAAKPLQGHSDEE